MQVVDVGILQSKRTELQQTIIALEQNIHAHHGALSVIEHLLGDDVPKIEIEKADVETESAS